MNSTRLLQTVVGKLVMAGITYTALAVIVSAQVQTQQTSQQGAATQTATVERGEVVLVTGNDLVVRMENGEIRHFPNIPDSARATVGGKELSVHELKPGMKLERTTVTSTAPQTIKTVKTVTGTVWQVSPPTSVILTLADGTNQRFTIPKNQKFTVNGQETDAFGLRKGMRISATAVTEEQQTVSSQQARVSGQMPTPPPAPSQGAPLLIVESAPTPAPAAAPARAAAAPVQVASAAPEPAPQELPHTASPVPLIGLLGLLSLTAAFGVRILRRVKSAAR